MDAKLLMLGLGWDRDDRKHYYVTTTRPVVVLALGVLLGYLLAMITVLIVGW